MSSSLWHFLNTGPRKGRLQFWRPLPLHTCTAQALRKLPHQFSRAFCRNQGGCRRWLLTGTQSLRLRSGQREGLNMEDWKRRRNDWRRRRHRGQGREKHQSSTVRQKFCMSFRKCNCKYLIASWDVLQPAIRSFMIFSFHSSPFFLSLFFFS